MNPLLKKKSKHLLQATIVVMMLMTSTLQLPLNHQSIVDRASRLLQTSSTSGYTIVTHPDVKTNCDDQGIAASSLALTNAQRDEEQSKFSGANHALVTEINGSTSQVNYGSLITKAIGGPLGVSGVFFVFSVLSLFFLFFWSLLECCCKRTCCMKEPEPGAPPRSKVRIGCWISGAVIAIATVGVVIGWVVYLGKLAGSAKDFKCGMTIFYSDIVKGTKLESGGSFAGTSGLSTILTSYISFIDSVPSIKTDANAVIAFGLKTLGATALSKYSSFKTSFSATGYNYKGAKTSSATVVPNIATAIKGGIDGSAFESEVNTLNKTGGQIHDAVVQIAAYDTSSLSSAKSSLTSLKTTLSDSLESPITNMYNSVAGNGTDYGASIDSAMKTFMIVSIILIILFTAGYLVILYFTARLNKFHGLKVISKIIMNIQLLLGVAILLFAIFGSIISIVFIVACALMDGIISSPDYLSKFSSDKKISDVMSRCVYKNGDGDLLKALGADLTEINKITTISDGMQSYDALSSNLTGQTAPWVGGNFSTNFTNYLAFSDVGRGTPDTEDVKTGYEYFNTLKCSQDQISPKVLSGYTESATGHAFDFGKGTNYCITFGKLPGSGAYTTMTNRYTAAPAATCTGAGTVSAATGGAALQTVYDSIFDYVNKYTNMNSFYNTNFYTAESNLFQKLKDSVPYLQRINAKVSDATSTLNNLNGTFKAVADCTVIRKEIILLENVLCYRTGDKFITMNNLAVAVGVMIFFYSWCICCGIRLATKREEQKPGAVSPDGFNKVGDQSGVTPFAPEGNQAQSVSASKNATFMNQPKYV